MAWPWTKDDDDLLLELLGQNLSNIDIGRKMARTSMAVAARLIKIQDRLSPEQRAKKPQARRPWTPEESARAVALYNSGVSTPYIAKRLGRNQNNVWSQLRLARSTPEQREEIQRKRREENRRSISLKKAIGTMDRVLETNSPTDIPDLELLRERDYRAALEPRDLTGLLMGDPPRGLSALDTRKSNCNAEKEEASTAVAAGHTPHAL